MYTVHAHIAIKDWASSYAYHILRVKVLFMDEVTSKKVTLKLSLYIFAVRPLASFQGLPHFLFLSTKSVKGMGTPIT